MELVELGGETSALFDVVGVGGDEGEGKENFLGEEVDAGGDDAAPEKMLAT